MPEPPCLKVNEEVNDRRLADVASRLQVDYSLSLGSWLDGLRFGTQSMFGHPCDIVIKTALGESPNVQVLVEGKQAN